MPFGAKLVKASAHYGLFLPAKCVLGLAVILEIGEHVSGWFGITVLEPLARWVKTDALAPSLGFKNGITPFSSWINFKLYVVMVITTSCLVLPILRKADAIAGTPKGAERTRLRRAIGNRLELIEACSHMFLLFILGLWLLGIIAEPLSPLLRWPLLTALGIMMMVDSLRFSVKRAQYGLEDVIDSLQERIFPWLARRVSGGKFDYEEWKRTTDD